MKNSLFICILVIFVCLACNHLQQAPIQSRNDILPYFEKHLGHPTGIDTIPLDSPNEIIFGFHYKERSDLSYKKIADVISKGFNIPNYSLDTLTMPGIIKMFPSQTSLKEHTVHKIEFGKTSKNSDSYLICILVENNKNQPSCK